MEGARSELAAPRAAAAELEHLRAELAASPLFRDVQHAAFVELLTIR